MDFSSPTAPPKERISGCFASPTGVIDETRNNLRIPIPHFPDLQQSPTLESKNRIDHTLPTDIPGLTNLPSLLGPDAEDMEDDDEETTRVAATFEEKEQKRKVKFCPWSQGLECSSDFRKKAHRMEKEEATSFRKLRGFEKRQEDPSSAQRKEAFRKLAFEKQQEEARDFKSMFRIRRAVRSLDHSARKLANSKRMYDEAMRD